MGTTMHDKKVALVTGANKGIGFEIGRQLHVLRDEGHGKFSEAANEVRQVPRGKAGDVQLHDIRHRK